MAPRAVFGLNPSLDQDFVVAGAQLLKTERAGSAGRDRDRARRLAYLQRNLRSAERRRVLVEDGPGDNACKWWTLSAYGDESNEQQQ
jgi:hypothetical protein